MLCTFIVFSPPDTEPLAFFWETWNNCHCNLATVPESVAILILLCRYKTVRPLQLRDLHAERVETKDTEEKHPDRWYPASTPLEPSSLAVWTWLWQILKHVDVGQNGRPSKPQMWMSSFVLTIHNFGVPNFDPYPCSDKLCMCVTLWSHTLRFLAQLYMSLSEHFGSTTQIWWLVIVSP